MSSVVSQRGKVFSSYSVKGSGGAVLSSSFKSALSSGRLMVVFMTGYNESNLSGLQTYMGYDTYRAMTFSGTHAMAVYGYREYSYYDDYSDLIRTDTYLYVFSGDSIGLTRINTHGTLDDAYVSYIV
jgi:uncharacterized protein YvpB